MPKGLPKNVKDNLEKCRTSAIAAVDVYNRPGPRFRTAQYIVLITMAWTALLHALFYRKGKRPWYRKPGSAGTGVRYVKIDGDPKHWELSECLKQHYGDKNPPERRNLEFLIGLRNKIEHRHLPELDPALYGECQAALLNLEDLLVQEFGNKWALQEQLAVSLQFSRLIPEEKSKATKALASDAAKSVKEYVETFRGGLPGPTLNSLKYSFTVYLVPKVAGSSSMADAAVEFVKLDQATPDELERLQKLNVLIREKHVPIANLGLYKPGDVVAELGRLLPWQINSHVHVRAWKYHKVRPPAGDAHPERTTPEYCVFDETHEDYVYTKAWINKLASELANAQHFEKVVGSPPQAK